MQQKGSLAAPPPPQTKKKINKQSCKIFLTLNLNTQILNYKPGFVVKFSVQQEDDFLDDWDSEEDEDSDGVPYKGFRV